MAGDPVIPADQAFAPYRLWTPENAHEKTEEAGSGFGDEFMVGRKKRASLPKEIIALVKHVYAQASDRLGPVPFGWGAGQGGRCCSK